MIKFNQIQKANIYLIGAGGTGGFTLTTLARLLAGASVPLDIHVFDGDAVEVKNLKRQNFSYSQVDLNKAEALAGTITNTIQDAPNITVYDKYITSVDDFAADILLSLPDQNTTPIIISAVDNVATRKLINETLTTLGTDYIAIDSGNNNQGGQVVVTSSSRVHYTQNPYDDGYKVKLANMFEVYPELNSIEDKNPGLHISCGDVTDSEPQAMMANIRNADIIANIVASLIGNKPLVGNVYESNLESFTTNVKTVFADE